MKQRKQKLNLTGWWPSVFAVIIIGILVFQYRGSLTTPSEAATLGVPPTSVCQSTIIPIKTYYVSTYGSDVDFTSKGVRRGGLGEPFRSIRHALGVAPEYLSRKVVIIGDNYEFDYDLDGMLHDGGNVITIPDKAKVWITKFTGTTRIVDWYNRQSDLRTLYLRSYADQLLIDNLIFDNVGLSIDIRGKSPDNYCRINLRYNQIIANQTPISNTSLNVVSQPNEYLDYIKETEYSAGRGQILSNKIELYDNSADASLRLYNGLMVMSGGTSSYVVKNNQFTFPKYGTNFRDDGAPRTYIGIEAVAENGGKITIENNIFATKQYDPSGGTENNFGIHMISGFNVVIGINNFASFQGIPTLVED